jgi:hypothetical protein
MAVKLTLDVNDVFEKEMKHFYDDGYLAVIEKIPGAINFGVMKRSFSLFKNIIRLINCIFPAVFRSFQFFNNQNRIAFLFLLLFFWV